MSKLVFLIKQKVFNIESNKFVPVNLSIFGLKNKNWGLRYKFWEKYGVFTQKHIFSVAVKNWPQKDKMRFDVHLN